MAHRPIRLLRRPSAAPARALALALAATLLAAALATPAGATPGPKSLAVLRDWIVACDQHLTCRAIGTDGESNSGAYLIIDRSLEDPEAWTAGLGQVELELETGMLLAIDETLVDGITTIADSDAGLSMIAFNRPGDRAQFMGALLAGSTLSELGDPARQVSLSGITASLLWMDEAQGLLGTPQAFVGKTAARKPVATPPRRERPITGDPKASVEWRVPQALRDRHTASPDCEAAYAAESWDPMITPLSEAQAIIGLPCFTGAYNVSYQFYLTGRDGRDAQLLEFSVPAFRDGQRIAASDFLINPSVGESGPIEITSFNKGRGIGDCGDYGTWAWRGDRFTATTYALMPSCELVMPDHWPLLIRGAE